MVLRLEITGCFVGTAFGVWVEIECDVALGALYYLTAPSASVGRV